MACRKLIYNWAGNATSLSPGRPGCLLEFSPNHGSGVYDVRLKILTALGISGVSFIIDGLQLA